MRALILSFLYAFLACAAEYKGKWASAYSGSSGTIRMTLEPGSDAMFTLDGSEVKCKVAKSSIDGNSVEMEFHFTIDGADLKSVYKATKEGNKLSGKYVTSIRAEGTVIDGGSIEVTEAN